MPSLGMNRRTNGRTTTDQGRAAANGRWAKGPGKQTSQVATWPVLAHEASTFQTEEST